MLGSCFPCYCWPLRRESRKQTKITPFHRPIIWIKHARSEQTTAFCQLHHRTKLAIPCNAISEELDFFPWGERLKSRKNVSPGFSTYIWEVFFFSCYRLLRWERGLCMALCYIECERDLLHSVIYESRLNVHTFLKTTFREVLKNKEITSKFDYYPE